MYFRSRRYWYCYYCIRRFRAICLFSRPNVIFVHRYKIEAVYAARRLCVVIVSLTAAGGRMSNLHGFAPAISATFPVGSAGYRGYICFRLVGETRVRDIILNSLEITRCARYHYARTLRGPCSRRTRPSATHTYTYIIITSGIPQGQLTCLSSHSCYFASNFPAERCGCHSDVNRRSPTYLQTSWAAVDVRRPMTINLGPFLFFILFAYQTCL